MVIVKAISRRKPHREIVASLVAFAAAFGETAVAAKGGVHRKEELDCEGDVSQVTS